MEENNNTKRCPYCGEEVKAIAKKCKYCGEFLDKGNDDTIATKICPFCCEKIPQEENVCPQCGENLQKNKFKQLINKLPLPIIIAIGTCLSITLLATIIIFNHVTELPKCDSEFAEQQVLSIVNGNNDQIKYYNKRGELAYLSLDAPQAISYNKDVNRYECSARVTFHANTVFNQGQYNEKSSMSCIVNYSISKSKGKPLVLSSYCSGYDYAR